MTTANIKAAVLGWPVGQSLSPRLHGYWLKQYGINGSYQALAVEPRELKRTLQKLLDEGYAGVNITLPHKEEALRLVHTADDLARRIGAVNTIVMREGKMHGTNTDAYGFIQSLKDREVSFAGCRAMVLGAGGGARAVCAALLAQGVDVIVSNRTFEKAQRLAESHGGSIIALEWDRCEQAMSDITLLVNTTSQGMKGEKSLTLSLAALPAGSVVADIIYNPLLTPLLLDAQSKGYTTVGGIGMLLYQAQPGFEAWFGILPEVTDELRMHVLAGMK